MGRLEQAAQMERDIYRGRQKLNGEEHEETLQAALNFAVALHCLKRFEEAKSLLRKTIPAARRVFGANNYITLTMKMNYAQGLFQDDGATFDDLHEAVTTLEEIERIARRVFGGANPRTTTCGERLRTARAVLRAREAGKNVVFAK